MEKCENQQKCKTILLMEFIKRFILFGKAKFYL